MNRRSLWTLIVSLLLIAFIAVPSGAQDTIKIGFVSAYTGPAAADGTSTLVGGRVAVSEINAAGGLLGKKIKIIAGDSRAIPSEAINVIKRLVIQDKVVAADCCWFSTSTLAARPIIDELRIPTVNGISFFPNARKVKLNYLFKHAHTPPLEGRFVDYWVNKMGVKRVAFLARNDDWGRGTVEAYIDRLKELGGTVLAAEFYAPGGKDFYSYLTRLKALNPEGINMVDISATGATIVRQIKELGIKTALLGSDGQVTDTFIKLAKGAAEGTVLVTRYEYNMAFADSAVSERNRKFVRGFKALRKGEVPNQYAQAGYDGVYLLAAAIKKVGGTDSRKIRDALRNIEVKSVAGYTIRFDKYQQALPKIYVAVIKDGKRVIVEEIDTKGVGYW